MTNTYTNTFRRAAIAIALSVSASSLQAQAKAPKGALPTTAPIVLTLMRDVDGLADKMIGLAKTMPVDKYDWRPGPGVRSVREVFLHVASDNYLLPALVGTAAPAVTGIDVKDFKSVDRFEKRPLSRDSVVAELTRSFAHLAGAMAKTNASQLTTSVTFFGQPSTMQDTWVLTTTHLHEHLGQGIAYARVNAITPPWTK